MKLFKYLFLLSVLSCTFDHPDPKVDLSEFLIPEDLVIRAVSAEPTIISPVDMSFDDKGRLWVVEMRGYMPNIAGTDEEIRNGRISILQDHNKDGFAESVNVFLDSLILPRAISHAYGGLLYVESPNLWFVEINADLTPGSRTLVDSTYAVGGNVEHQANGLLVNIDNWIYSAKASRRYRRVNGEWLIEKNLFPWTVGNNEG